MPVRAVTTRFMYKGLCTIPDILAYRPPVILPEDEVEGESLLVGWLDAWMDVSSVGFLVCWMYGRSVDWMDGSLDGWMVRLSLGQSFSWLDSCSVISRCEWLAASESKVRLVNQFRTLERSCQCALLFLIHTSGCTVGRRSNTASVLTYICSTSWWQFTYSIIFITLCFICFVVTDLSLHLCLFFDNFHFSSK